jgi:hypothetical protein
MTANEIKSQIEILKRSNSSIVKMLNGELDHTQSTDELKHLLRRQRNQLADLELKLEQKV